MAIWPLPGRYSLGHTGNLRGYGSAAPSEDTEIERHTRANWRAATTTKLGKMKAQPPAQAPQKPARR
jgi:hypothetical protein